MERNFFNHLHFIKSVHGSGSAPGTSLYHRILNQLLGDSKSNISKHWFLWGGDSLSGLFNQLGFKVSNGLWGSKTCVLDQCQTSEFGSIPDWLHVTRLFATLSLIGFVVTTVGVFVCLFVTQLSQRRILHILTCVVATSTAVCVLVAVIIYGTQYNNLDQRFLTQTDKDPSWSYGLCVAALILDIITSILLAINTLRKPII